MMSQTSSNIPKGTFVAILSELKMSSYNLDMPDVLAACAIFRNKKEEEFNFWI